MSFFHLSTGILDHFPANCSRSLRFQGYFFLTAVLIRHHMCTMGFRSELVAGHFRTLQCFVLNHFWVLSEIRLASMPCQKTHDFWWRRIVLTLSPIFCFKFLWYASDFMMPCTQSRHTGPEAAKQPQKNMWLFTMFDHRDCVLFIAGLISFIVNSTMMWVTKDLHFGLICPQDVLLESCLLPQASSGNLQSGFLCLCVGSSWVSYHSIPFHSE